jgi:hypothetical protein
MDTNEVSSCAIRRAGKTYWTRLIGTAMASIPFAAAPNAASAHALAQRHELPVPLALYLGAAGAAVGLSALLLASLARARPRERGYAKLDLHKAWVARVAAALLGWSLRVIGVAAFLLVVLAGLVGNQHGLKNIAPVLVWVIWWVGVSFLCALAGNVWPMLDPWRTLFDAVAHHRGSEAAHMRWRPYPDWLGTWPAVGFLLVFIWMELVWTGAERPRALASAVLLYSAFTWAGMRAFGRDVWLQKAEAFNVFFGILGRFAPISAGAGDPDPPGTLRPYALGLMPDRPLSASRLAFIILMLAAVSFDGLLETPAWDALLEGLLSASVLEPASRLFGIARADAEAALVSLALVISPALLFLAYFVTCRIAAWAVMRAGDGHERPWTASELSRMFAPSLVPIAIAYMFAHYLSYLLLAGQLAIPLASDPFGVGWNLFGTVLYRFDIGIIDARSVWFVCLTAIVLGHCAAVYLAHRTALLLFRETRLSLISQIPMVALMIAYTMSSLWMLAQPIVVAPPLG